MQVNKNDNKATPNSKAIKACRNELSLTVRDVGDLLKGEMSTRTFTTIENSSKEVFVHQIEKILNLFNSQYKIKKINKNLDINELIKKSSKPVKFHKIIDYFDTDNLSFHLGKDFMHNDSWLRQEKIIRYLCEINDETSILISDVLESIDELAKLSDKQANIWFYHKDDKSVSNEVIALKANAKVQKALTKLYEKGIKVFYTNFLRHDEVRFDPSELSIDDSNYLSGNIKLKAHIVRYFLIVFTKDITQRVEVKYSCNYTIDSLNEIIAEKNISRGVEKKTFSWIKEGIKERFKDINPAIPLDNSNLNLNLIEKSFDQIRKEFTDYIKSQCHRVLNYKPRCSKNEKNEVLKLREKWLEILDGQDETILNDPYLELEFDHYLGEIFVKEEGN